MFCRIKVKKWDFAFWSKERKKDYVNVSPLCSNYPRSGPPLFCIQKIQKIQTIPEIRKPQFFTDKTSLSQVCFLSIMLLINCFAQSHTLIVSMHTCQILLYGRNNVLFLQIMKLIVPEAWSKLLMSGTKIGISISNNILSSSKQDLGFSSYLFRGLKVGSRSA